MQPEQGEGTGPLTESNTGNIETKMPTDEELQGAEAMVTEALKSRDQKIFDLQKKTTELDQRILDLETILKDTIQSLQRTGQLNRPPETEQGGY